MSDTPEFIDYDPLWAQALRQLAALGQTLEQLSAAEGLPPLVARAVAGLRWAVANGRAELQSDFLCPGAAEGADPDAEDHPRIPSPWYRLTCRGRGDPGGVPDGAN